ncbi:unnamed protein product [Amoebophrya sp. A25]|nr:unnamed protein product [Amoebophrya sp. A25]|eukprot:GSA25T00004288001.1
MNQDGLSSSAQKERRSVRSSTSVSQVLDDEGAEGSSGYCSVEYTLVTDLLTGVSAVREPPFAHITSERAVFLNLYHVQLGSVFGFRMLNRAVSALDFTTVSEDSDMPLGVYHAGVEVFGREFQYGFAAKGCGIHCLRPRVARPHLYARSLYLGETPSGRKGVFAEIVGRKLAPSWQGADYDTQKRNCLDFAQCLAEALEVDHKKLDPLIQYSRWWPFSAALS